MRKIFFRTVLIGSLVFISACANKNQEIPADLPFPPLEEFDAIMEAEEDAPEIEEQLLNDAESFDAEE